MLVPLFRSVKLINDKYGMYAVLGNHCTEPFQKKEAMHQIHI